MQLVGITSLLIHQLSGKKSFIACWIKNRHKHTGTITTTEGGTAIAGRDVPDHTGRENNRFP